MTLPTRNEIPTEDTWDLSRIFKNDQEWEKEFQQTQSEVQTINQAKEKFNTAAELYGTLTRFLAIKRRIEKLLAYASLSSDVDTSNNHYLGCLSRVQNLTNKFEASTAFLSPAILQLSPKKLTAFIQEEPKLKIFQHFLDKITHKRQHTLSANEEKIVDEAQAALQTPENTFNILSNSDLKYGYVMDEDGEMVQLTDGLYSVLIQSQDRKVRKNAFDVLYASYDQFQNTFAATLSGAVKAHNYQARVHHYHSAREAALDKNNIPIAVYDTLISEVHQHLDLLHRYVTLRKKILEVDNLQMWDMYVPLIGQLSSSFDFKQAKKIAKDALSILGTNYIKQVDYLFNNRIIDPFENQNKATGAYSGGSYDTDPYELLNWDGTLDSIYTLVHETGHSVHSRYSRINQPYVYGNYPIFVAEIASTTNENLLTEYLLKQASDPGMRAFLLNYCLDSFKGTLFRQAQFAEFEQKIHELDAKGQALTAETLNNYYADLNQKYYGKSVEKDSDIDKEWARIPHFYYNFYVYQYATGFAAANALTQKIMTGNKQAIKQYLDFLKAGSSDYPIELVKKAGIDMTQPAYLENSFKIFENRLNELENLIVKI